MAAIILPMAFFFDISLAVKGTMNLKAASAAIAAILLNGTAAAIAASSLILFQKSRAKTEANAGRTPMRKLSVLPITLVCAVYAIVSFFQYTQLPCGDGTGYYRALTQAIDAFTYTYPSFLENLRLYGHPAQGMVLFSGAGEMLAGWHGVYIVQVILVMAGMLCMYDILGRVFLNLSSTVKSLGVALFAFSPYILGLTSHYNPDLYTAVFFIFAVYFFLHDWDFLVSLSLILLYLSKETGLLFGAGFFVCAIFRRIRKMEGGSFISRAIRYLWPGKLILYLIPELVFFLPGVFRFSEGSVTTGSSYVNVFAVRLGNISVHLKQSFAYNFFWLYLALFIAVLCVAFFRIHNNIKRESSIFRDEDAFWGIISAAFFYLFFMVVLYATSPCPRYSQPLVFTHAVAGIAMLLYIWKNRKIVTIILLCLSSLFFAQCYFSLDPSMMNNYSLDLGRQKIYGPVDFYVAADCDITFLCEMYAYNQLSTYSDSLMTDILTRINPTKETIFYACGYDYYEIYNGGNIYWNPSLKQIEEISSDDNFRLRITWVDDYALIDDDPMHFYSDFYVILPARRDRNDMAAALYYGESIAEKDKIPNRFAAKGCTEEEYFKADNWAGYLAVYRYKYTG